MTKMETDASPVHTGFVDQVQCRQGDFSFRWPQLSSSAGSSAHKSYYDVMIIRRDDCQSALFMRFFFLLSNVIFSRIIASGISIDEIR